MVPRRALAFCSIVRLAKQREGLGVQSLANNSNLQLSGFRGFVLDGIKRFQYCPSSMSYRVEGNHDTPETQRSTKENANHIEFIDPFAQ